MIVEAPSTIPCVLCGDTGTQVYIAGECDGLTLENVGSSRKRISFGEILRCSRCTFGFQAFRPREDQLAALYRDADDTVYDAERAGRLRTAKSHARLVSQHRETPGRLLDVGCASGAFLEEMVARGWEIEGVEPSRQHFRSASLLLEGRARLQQCTLQEAEFFGRFDAVTAWDVLEHVADPVAFLLSCAQSVKPGGYLFLNVPDLDSLQAQLMGRRWPLLLAEHLNYFNEKSLRICAGRAGFAWQATGQRAVTFSLQYIAHRLSQHSLPGMQQAADWVRNSALGRMIVPIRMGERFAVLMKPAQQPAVSHG